jgi:hypothetical protein
MEEGLHILRNVGLNSRDERMAEPLRGQLIGDLYEGVLVTMAI